MSASAFPPAFCHLKTAYPPRLCSFSRRRSWATRLKRAPLSVRRPCAPFAFPALCSLRPRWGRFSAAAALRFFFGRWPCPRLRLVSFFPLEVCFGFCLVLWFPSFLFFPPCFWPCLPLAGCRGWGGVWLFGWRRCPRGSFCPGCWWGVFLACSGCFFFFRCWRCFLFFPAFCSGCCFCWGFCGLVGWGSAFSAPACPSGRPFCGRCRPRFWWGRVLGWGSPWPWVFVGRGLSGVSPVPCLAFFPFAVPRPWPCGRLGAVPVLWAALLSLCALPKDSSSAAFVRFLNLVCAELPGVPTPAERIFRC